MLYCKYNNYCLLLLLLLCNNPTIQFNFDIALNASIHNKKKYNLLEFPWTILKFLFSCPYKEKWYTLTFLRNKVFENKAVAQIILVFLFVNYGVQTWKNMTNWPEVLIEWEVFLNRYWLVLYMLKCTDESIGLQKKCKGLKKFLFPFNSWTFKKHFLLIYFATCFILSAFVFIFHLIYLLSFHLLTRPYIY